MPLFYEELVRITHEQTKVWSEVHIGICTSSSKVVGSTCPKLRGIGILLRNTYHLLPRARSNKELLSHPFS